MDVIESAITENHNHVSRFQHRNDSIHNRSGVLFLKRGMTRFGVHDTEGFDPQSQRRPFRKTRDDPLWRSHPQRPSDSIARFRGSAPAWRLALSKPHRPILALQEAAVEKRRGASCSNGAQKWPKNK